MARPVMTPSDDERALIRRILAHTNSLEAGYLVTDTAIDVFNRSGLSRPQLREVWKLADADANGRIAQDELAVAIRLMGWMQSGQPFSEGLLEKPGPLPVLDGIAPPTPPQKDPALFPKSAFPPVIPAEVRDYSNIFQTGGPIEGCLEGEKVRDIYLKSNLAYRDLSSIWVLLDTTHRGRLNFLEFALGMYLIKAIRSCHLNGVPPSIPPEVRQEVEQVVNELHSPFLAPGETPSMPVLTVSPTSPPPSRPVPPTPPTPPSKTPRVPPKPPPVKPRSGSKPWAVPPLDREEYEAEFAQLGSGYITRDVAWDHFRRYNVSEDEIAQIVHLASIRKDGHLSSDEFIVAMHLVQNKLKGKAIPQELPPSLIPPSLRQSSSQPSTMDQPTPLPRDTPHPTVRSTLRPRSASQAARGPSAFYLVTPSAEVLGPQTELQTSPTGYAAPFDGVLYPSRGSIAVSPGLMSRRSTLSFVPTPEEDPLEELKSETKTLRRQIDNLLDQLGTQNELRKDNDALRNENVGLKAKVSELEANVASVIMQMQNSDNALVMELSTEVERLTKRVGELAQTETQLEQAARSLEDSKRQNTDLNTQIRDLRKAETEHKAEIEDAKHAMEELEAENKDVKTRLMDMTKAIQGPDGKDGKESKNLSTKQLRVLLQDTNRENATLKERVRQVERSMETLLTSQNAAKSDELQRHNRELRMQVHELETLAGQLQSSQDDHHLRQVFEAVSRENESMKGKMRELQASLTRQRGEHDTRVADLQRRLDELSQENAQLKMDLRNNRRTSTQSANDVPPPAYDDSYIPPDVS